MKRFALFFVRVWMLAAVCLLIMGASALASSIEAYGLKISRSGLSKIDFFVSEANNGIMLTEGGNYTVELSGEETADGCIYLACDSDVTLTLRDVLIVGTGNFAPITQASNVNVTIEFEGHCALTGRNTPAIQRLLADSANSLSIVSGADNASLNLVTRADTCAALGTAGDVDLYKMNIRLDHAGSSVSANGGPNGAGIGSGARGDAAYLKIYMNGDGCSINAKGGLGAAGIGSGFFGDVQYFELNINAHNCTVTSEGGQGAAGIGSGFKGDVSHMAIFSDASKSGGTGSTITAIGRDGGAGIGSGERYGGSGGRVEGLIIIANANDQFTGRAVCSSESLPGGAGIGSGAKGTLASLEINGGRVIAEGGVGAAGVGSGAGGNLSPNGICIAENILNRRTSVTARGGAYGPGIGAGFGNTAAESYEINITGGSVNATGGERAAGIGGGYEASARDIRITGGTVFATGGAYAAGIGGGANGKLEGEDNIIKNAVVTAVGGVYGPGIGGGKNGAIDGLTIDEGARVTATGGAGAAGIGGGPQCDAGGIKLLAGHVTATGGAGAAGIGGGLYAKLDGLLVSGGTHVVSGATISCTDTPVYITGGSMKAEFDKSPSNLESVKVVMREIRLKYMRDSNPPDAYSMTLFRTGAYDYGFTEVTPAVDGLDGKLYLWLPEDADVLTLTTGSAAGRAYDRLQENLGRYPLNMYDHDYKVILDGAEYASGNFANTLAFFRMIGAYHAYTLEMEEGVERSDAYIDAAMGDNVTVRDLQVAVTNSGNPALYTGDGTLTLSGGNAFVNYAAGQSAVAGNVLTINGGGSMAASAVDAPAIRAMQSLTINGGVISAETSASGVPVIRAGGIGNIAINGGTLSAVAGGATGEIRPAENRAVEITGGSVNADIARAVRGGQTLNRQVLSINSGADFTTSRTKVTGLELVYTSSGQAFAYGIADMYTDDSGKIYLWVPAGVSLKSITVGGATIAPPGGLSLDGSDKRIAGAQYVVKDANGNIIEGLETETGLTIDRDCAVTLASGLERAVKPIIIASGANNEITVTLDGVTTDGGISVLRSGVTLILKNTAVNSNISILRDHYCFLKVEGVSRVALGLSMTGTSSGLNTSFYLLGTGSAYIGGTTDVQYLTINGGSWRIDALNAREYLDIFGGSVFISDLTGKAPMRGSAHIYPADICCSSGEAGVAGTVTGLGEGYNASNMVSAEDGFYRLWLPEGDYSEIYLNGAGPYAGAVSSDGGILQLAAIAERPLGTMGYVGQTLSEIALINPEGNTGGAWAWDSPETLLVNDDAPQYYAASFFPTLGNLYKSVTGVQVQLIVQYSGIAIDDTPLPAGIVGESFSYAISCPGEEEIAQYFATGLPAGLTLDKVTGVISGTPTVTGAYPVVLGVSAPPRGGERSVTINIYEKPMIVTDAALADGTFDEPLECQLTATGTADIGFFVVDGALPLGVTLSETGLLCGTPEKSGDFAFIVRAANHWGENEKEFTLHIASGVASIAGAVKGYCQTEITVPRVVAITLTGREFAPSIGNAYGWIVNLPVGLEAKAVRVSDTRVNIEITGVARIPASNEIEVIIPGGRLSLGGLNVDMDSYPVETDAAAHYDIRTPLTIEGEGFTGFTEGDYDGNAATYTVRNDTPYSITGISVNLTKNDGSFAITGVPAEALEPGQSADITVTCGNRLKAGDYEDSLTVVWDDCETGKTVDLSLTVAPLTDSVMKLPASITEICAEAFAGGTFKKVIIPDGCTEIGARAFADNANLRVVYIPASVLVIAADAFDGCPNAILFDDE